jgi:hypothetical protein
LAANEAALEDQLSDFHPDTAASMPSQHRQQPSSVDEEDKRLFRIALEGLESRPDLSLLSTIPRLDGVRLLIWIHRMEFGLLLQTPRVARRVGMAI